MPCMRNANPDSASSVNGIDAIADQIGQQLANLSWYGADSQISVDLVFKLDALVVRLGGKW